MSTEHKQEAYQIVAFFIEAIPAFFDNEDPGAAALRLAADDLGIKPEDLHPTHKGRFNGRGRYVWHFEIYVKRAASQGLLSRGHPQVLEIFD